VSRYKVQADQQAKRDVWGLSPDVSVKSPGGSYVGDLRASALTLLRMGGTCGLPGSTANSAMTAGGFVPKAWNEPSENEDWRSDRKRFRRLLSLSSPTAGRVDDNHTAA